MQNTYKKYHKQRGISLYVVIVLVLLSTLLALWASRTALFNEMIVGNDADYQRAFEAAQAMIQDAELDIQRSAADGSACVPDGAKPDQCRPAPCSAPRQLPRRQLLRAFARSGTSARTRRASSHRWPREPLPSRLLAYGLADFP